MDNIITLILVFIANVVCFLSGYIVGQRDAYKDVTKDIEEAIKELDNGQKRDSE